MLPTYSVHALAFALLASMTLAAHAETVTGRVVTIVDGDTLTLLDAANQQHRIRLSAIDAPEITQDFGQNAKTGLSALAFNQPATANCHRASPPAIETCVVTIGGKDIGLEQVLAGMAWWHQQFAGEQSTQEAADYQQAEFNARIRRFGLWHSKNPTPPWDWRHGRAED